MRSRGRRPPRRDAGDTRARARARAHTPPCYPPLPRTRDHHPLPPPSTTTLYHHPSTTTPYHHPLPPPLYHRPLPSPSPLAPTWTRRWTRPSY